MAEPVASQQILKCEGCGTQVTPAMLACPVCQRLVHAQQLKSLAAQAEAAQSAGNLSEALAHWRSVQELLPPETKQHAQISERITGLSAEIEKQPADKRPAAPGQSKSGWAKGAAGAGAVGLLAWKLKFAVVFLLTKGKLLLLGLTKASTIFSMALSLGVYWSLWGWRFALGFIVAMYVHEMGHVAALRKYGIAATAPMFVPGLGAFVRLKQYPATPQEDAEVGLAGPMWGAGASLAFWIAGNYTGWPMLAAIAYVSAWLNLFNLMPVWSLDGGRGFRGLSKTERWIVIAAMAVMWGFTEEFLLAALTVLGIGRALMSEAPKEGHRATLYRFVGLVVVLSLLTMVRPAGLPGR
ncbi:MAG TPA: site-2 protease family protein [Myxococcales bacterium]|jgi:Zn-dependent protease